MPSCSASVASSASAAAALYCWPLRRRSRRRRLPGLAVLGSCARVYFRVPLQHLCRAVPTVLLRRPPPTTGCPVSVSSFDSGALAHHGAVAASTMSRAVATLGCKCYQRHPRCQAAVPSAVPCCSVMLPCLLPSLTFGVGLRESSRGACHAVSVLQSFTFGFRFN